MKNSFNKKSTDSDQLLSAISSNNIERARLLVENRANVEQETYFNSYPIVEAGYNGCHEILDLLIKHDADLNAQNGFGFTALIWATIREHEETVELLIKHGAKIDIKNNAGKTALMCAKDNSNIKKLLEQAIELKKKNTINDISKAVARRSIYCKKPIKFN